jgi:hypothetical protein
MKELAFIFTFLFSIGFITMQAQEEPPPHSFKQSKKLLNGMWHIIATNCDELVNSDRDTVKLVFSDFKIKNNKMTFNESLIYYKSKTLKVQKALNLQKTQMQLNFIWTGKGNFDLFNRKWRVIASDSEGEWLVIQFIKTKKKFKAIAVITRNKNTTDQQLQDIVSYVAKSYLMPTLTSLN